MAYDDEDPLVGCGALALLFAGISGFIVGTLVGIFVGATLF